MGKQSKTKAKAGGECVFLSVPWAQDQCGFPSGVRSPYSQTQHGICNQQ